MQSLLKFSRSSFSPVVRQQLRLFGVYNHEVKARVTCDAPTFKGQAWADGQFKEISLNDYKGKYVVLFFYPLDFTFVCPTEIVAFNDKAKEFEKIGAQLIACSVDSHFTHMEYTKKPRDQGGLGNMDIPMLSDLNKQIAKDYGVITQDDAVSLRGTFIIDGKGVLRHSSINDLPVGRSPEETLRLVQAFQYVDVHGDVCPANWTPGSKTLETSMDSQKTKSYWKDELAK